MEVEVSFSTDTEGFVSQECPTCHWRFKVVFGQGSDEPISHCPYCSHVGKGCWWTPEQADYLAAVSGDQIVGPMLEKFAKDLNRTGRKGGLIKISAKVKRGPMPKPPHESDEPMIKVAFSCCGETVKVDRVSPSYRCVICGTEQKR